MESTSATESDRLLERRIVKSLRGRRGEATLADVVVDTGLPNLEVERLLRRMIGEFPCHLEVTEEGDILYHFDPAMRRYDQRDRLRRWLEAIGRPLWEWSEKPCIYKLSFDMILGLLLSRFRQDRKFEERP